MENNTINKSDFHQLYKLCEEQGFKHASIVWQRQTFVAQNPATTSIDKHLDHINTWLNSLLASNPKYTLRLSKNFVRGKGAVYNDITIITGNTEVLQPEILNGVQTMNLPDKQIADTLRENGVLSGKLEYLTGINKLLSEENKNLKDEINTLSEYILELEEAANETATSLNENTPGSILTAALKDGLPALVGMLVSLGSAKADEIALNNETKKQQPPQTQQGKTVKMPVNENAPIYTEDEIIALSQQQNQ